MDTVNEAYSDILKRQKEENERLEKNREVKDRLEKEIAELERKFFGRHHKTKDICILWFPESDFGALELKGILKKNESWNFDFREKSPLEPRNIEIEFLLSYIFPPKFSTCYHIGLVICNETNGDDRGKHIWTEFILNNNYSIDFSTINKFWILALTICKFLSSSCNSILKISHFSYGFTC
jgi:hypothetical protein